MENATKALTMAASILMALVIIGSILLVFNNLSKYQNLNDKLTKDAQVIEFNNRFETYNRTDVRGSDILSLINKVLDYNERQSFVGTEGSDVGYQPIKLTIDLGKNKTNIEVNSLSYERLITDENKYVIYYEETDQYEKTNEMETILEEIEEIESEYGQTELTKLAVAINSIFIENDSTQQDKDKAVEKYIEITEDTTASWSNLAPGGNIRKDVYKYYEYIQFKRSYFNCSKDVEGKTSGVVYDDNTGRITEMYFVGNGKIE